MFEKTRALQYSAVEAGIAIKTRLLMRYVNNPSEMDSIRVELEEAVKLYSMYFWGEEKQQLIEDGYRMINKCISYDNRSNLKVFAYALNLNQVKESGIIEFMINLIIDEKRHNNNTAIQKEIYETLFTIMHISINEKASITRIIQMFQSCEEMAIKDLYRINKE